MPNPILIQVTRGPLVESVHRGAVAICDSSGRLLAAVGDVEARVYPRSAVKALQAIPLVESGAADAFGFTKEELALACSSHNGEPRHVAAASAMLAKAGLSESDLECGPQPPRLPGDLAALSSKGHAPGRLHNNCSGKHAGMLALARRLGVDAKGYSQTTHPVQETVRSVMAEMTGSALRDDACGTDGCSIPTWAMPLSGLAAAFARLATGEGLTPERAAASARLREAVAAHPFMVAGTHRFCTGLMEATGPAAFVKTGAEGVFCAAFPDRGLGLALKIDDGATRASEVLMANIVQVLVPLECVAAQVVQRLARPPITNWAGTDVGEVRVEAEAFRDIRSSAAPEFRLSPE